MARRPADPAGELATVTVSLRITPTLEHRIRTFMSREGLRDRSTAIRAALERGTSADGR